jgi:hypothetical protein
LAKADIVTLSDDGVLDVGEKRGRQRRQGTGKLFARVLTLWRRPPECGRMDCRKVVFRSHR